MKQVSFVILTFLLYASFAVGEEGSGKDKPDSAGKQGVLQADEYGRNFECLSSGPAILTTCTEEMTIITETIEFDRNTSASLEEVQKVVADLEKAGLPSQSCCNLAVAFNKSSCHCDAVLGRLLPEVGVAFPALMSIFDVMERSCGNFQTRTCM